MEGRSGHDKKIDASSIVLWDHRQQGNRQWRGPEWKGNNGVRLDRVENGVEVDSCDQFFSNKCNATVLTTPLYQQQS
jgi:hypothetical protein